MKNILGVILIIFGVCAGLYVGFWWGFIGGIVQIIEQFNTPEVNAMDVAFGVAKIFFAGTLGWLTFIICFIFGRAVIE
jgi:hypothetical protein